MAISLREAWRRITTTRYTRMLEAEVARLRSENRALLNSILGIAGIPPVTASEADVLTVKSQADSFLPSSINPSQPGAIHSRQPKPATARNPGSVLAPNVIAPMRRRSWQQINRMLEFESATKEKVGAEPLPPAHI
ncbi:MAG: hypothetical protein ACRD59_12560 [Candidatus Acidiferrales bacterium]